MGLGVKVKNEPFRIFLTIQGAAPTGTPQIAIKGPLRLTDLASNGAGTGISSVAGGFEAGMVNGYLYIPADVGGFDAGSYEITVFTDINNITIGASAGANASVGTGIINNKTILAATNMVQDASTGIWYYDYVVAATAEKGLYQVYLTAVISGTTIYTVDNYSVGTANTSTDSSDVDYD